MIITIIATGSRGDVQPYIALGKGLKAAGYTVRLATHEDFEQLVRLHGLDYWPIKGNVTEVAQGAAMSELLENGNFLSIMSEMARAAEESAIHLVEGGLAACQGSDLMVGGLGGIYIGLAIAEKLDIPLLQAYYVPFTPTRAFPSVLLPMTLPNLGGALNYRSHHLTRQVMWQGFRRADKKARQQLLGLPKPSFWGPYRSKYAAGLPILYAFSPVVVPKPADWDENIQVTGYWFLDLTEDWSPPAQVSAFLEAGSKPLYIGFGSLSNQNPEATADLVLEALTRTGQRAIVLSGWGGLRKTELPETVLMVDSIPHAWLFPRMAAVVHHGGVGTTAAGLRAGVPSIVIPFFGDQPFWGQRVVALGVGPEPIPRKKLTVERLTLAIERAMSDQRMQEQSAELGERIRAEDGVKAAVAVVQQLEQKLTKET